MPEKVLKSGHDLLVCDDLAYRRRGLICDDAASSFYLVSGLLFLVVDVFATGFYGMLFYFSRRAFSPFLLKALSVRGPVVGASVQVLGFGLLAGEVVLVYLAASQCFGHLLAGDFPSLIIHVRSSSID